MLPDSGDQLVGLWPFNGHVLGKETVDPQRGRGVGNVLRMGERAPSLVFAREASLVLLGKPGDLQKAEATFLSL